MEKTNNNFYYVFYDEGKKTYDVIDCTNHDIQPIIKSFKYEGAALNYHCKLKAKKFNL